MTFSHCCKHPVRPLKGVRGSIFLLEHWIPCWQADGLLLQQIKNGSWAVAAVCYHAEHVFTEPLIGHDDVAILSAVRAPAVLYLPLDGIAVAVEVNCHQGHCVRAATVEGLDALLLVHAEGGAQQASIVEVVDVSYAHAAVEELAHVAAEVHLAAVFEGSNGNTLQILNGQVDVEPVVSVINVAVVVNLIYLIIWKN